MLLALVCEPLLAQHTVHYQYDALGRLIGQFDSQGVTVYTYDPAGNILSVSRNTSDQLSIIAFSPTRAKVGDPVTILGTGFFPDPAQNTVTFNGAPATVTSATPTGLVVTVPAGATDGPIGVTNARGSTTSATAFTLIAPPVIASVAPIAVARGVTTRVAITGTHLASTRTVSFSQAGITAHIVAGATHQLLEVDLQVLGTVPFGAYAFSVTNEAGTTESGNVTVEVSSAVLGDVLTATQPLSVHVPPLIPGAPPGNSMILTEPVSVHVPPLISGAPPGNSMILTEPVSVHVPPLISGAPPGNSLILTEPVSVHVPPLLSGAPPGDAMTVTEPASVLVPE